MTRTIAQYPHLQVTPGPDDIMWIFTGEWSLLDNFARTQVRVDVGWWPLTYLTAEHAFAAAKAQTGKEHYWIRCASSPGEAKSFGRSTPIRDDWEEVKLDIMWTVLQAKHDQHPAFRELLASTGTRRIFEGNTWGDEVWGVVQYGSTWCGRNALGQMLMELRG